MRARLSLAARPPLGARRGRLHSSGDGRRQAGQSNRRAEALIVSAVRTEHDVDAGSDALAGRDAGQRSGGRAAERPALPIAPQGEAGVARPMVERVHLNKNFGGRPL